MKSKFILAYNEFISYREKLVEACRAERKAEDIIVLVKNLIDQNSLEALNKDEFQKKYDSYDLKYKKIMSKIEEVGLEIEKKNS